MSVSGLSRAGCSRKPDGFANKGRHLRPGQIEAAVDGAGDESTDAESAVGEFTEWDDEGKDDAD